NQHEGPEFERITIGVISHDRVVGFDRDLDIGGRVLVGVIRPIRHGLFGRDVVVGGSVVSHLVCRRVVAIAVGVVTHVVCRRVIAIGVLGGLLSSLVLGRVVSGRGPI